MAANIQSSLVKTLKNNLRPARNLFRKYFSEVGYITREYNRHHGRILYRQNRKRRIELAAAIKPLSEPASSILHQLNSRGFCKTTLEALKIDHALLSRLEGYSKPFMGYSFADLEKMNASKAKNYWLKINNDWESDASLRDAILKNRYFLDLVSTYFGEIPHYSGFDYMYSPPYPAGEPLRGSHNWHLDNHHATVLKMFISPFTLTRAEGPTQILPSTLSTRKHYAGYPNYMTDKELFATGIKAEEQIFLTANPGELYLVDTARCLHCGSRNTSARHVAIVTFTSSDQYTFHRRRHDEQQQKITSANDSLIALYG